MNRRFFRCFTAAFVALIVALSMSLAASEPLANAVKSGKAESYIVIMADDPVLSYSGELEDFEATRPGKGKKINVNSAHVRKYQKFLRESHRKALADVGVDRAAQVHNYTVALNGFSAFLTEDEAKAIERQAGVVKVMKDTMRFLETDSSPAFLGLDVDGGAWDKGYTGEDVIVGIIDSGIWPEHPSFADDGSYSALPDYTAPPCEFGNTAHNPNDVSFTCNNKLLGAVQMLDTYRSIIGAEPGEFDSARDDDGHGTHTASTAAGNADVEASILGMPRGVVSGIAPRARIVAYKAIGKLGGFNSDLAAAIDQAVADGVDVINYSIGGGASPPSADEIAFLFAADAGVFSVTSAGNSGPGPGTVGNPGTMPWLTTVGSSTQSRSFEGSASSSDGWEFFGASITPGTDELPLVDAADAGDELCNVGLLNASLVAGKVVLCKRGAIARVAKSLAVYMAGGAGMILYNAFDEQTQNADTHWVPAVHINNSDGSMIKAYIGASADPVAQINGGEKVFVEAPYMAASSSRGPNLVSPDIIKPDLTAPGVNILAGASPMPADTQFVPGQLFQAISGTSMSSPHVAGVFALLKQAHPDWSAAIAKSALMTTAYQQVMKEDGVTPANLFDFGAGHLNVTGPLVKGSAFQPGLAYDAGLFEYAAYTCGEDFGIFTTGSCDFLDSIGVPSDPSDLNLPSIAISGLAGSQTVQRTVTSVAKGLRTFEVSVDAPAGFSVTVDPASFAIMSGETATYSVTITDEGAMAGEWQFGSLTWTDRSGKYSVRSPIAVSAD